MKKKKYMVKSYEQVEKTYIQVVMAENEEEAKKLADNKGNWQLHEEDYFGRKVEAKEITNVVVW